MCLCAWWTACVWVWFGNRVTVLWLCTWLHQELYLPCICSYKYYIWVTAFLSICLTVCLWCVKWKLCADVSVCDYASVHMGCDGMWPLMSVWFVCIWIKRNCVFLCDAIIWYSWVWDIGWSCCDCDICLGNVTDAVWLCIHDHFWNVYGCDSEAPAAWLCLSVAVLGDSCLWVVACLFFYNAWAMATRVCVCDWGWRTVHIS